MPTPQLFDLILQKGIKSKLLVKVTKHPTSDRVNKNLY